MKKENKSKWSFTKTTITELNAEKMQKIVGGVGDDQTVLTTTGTKTGNDAPDTISK